MYGRIALRRAVLCEVVGFACNMESARRAGFRPSVSLPCNCTVPALIALGGDDRSTGVDDGTVFDRLIGMVPLVEFCATIYQLRAAGELTRSPSKAVATLEPLTTRLMGRWRTAPIAADASHVRLPDPP